MTTLQGGPFRAIDLFCGCGGLSLGLRGAGFEVVAAVDNDPLSVSTYRRNHERDREHMSVIEKDIKDVVPQELMEKLELKPGELDLLAGCPPCQGFSILRTLNGSRRFVEPLNKLVFQFVRFAQVFRPQALMMENVPALRGNWRLTQVKRELRALDYNTEAEVFDAVEFGVPQRRRRMILLAVRKEYGRPSFAPPVRDRRTVADAIRWLPPPEDSLDPAHNYPVRRADHVLSLIRRIPKDGGSRTDLPEEEQLECHRNFRGFSNIYGRMAWNAPAPTITSGCINPSKGRFLHPEENRAVTLREAALLQGFPAWYDFDLTRGRYPTALLIGNAFPPRFAERHARSLLRQIGGTPMGAWWSEEAA